MSTHGWRDTLSLLHKNYGVLPTQLCAWLSYRVKYLEDLTYQHIALYLISLSGPWYSIVHTTVYLTRPISMGT